MPVLIHTAGIGPYLPGFRSAAGSPLLLEDVLVRHPKLRLFVENTGYPYRDEMIAMMTQYPQLHGDVSTIAGCSRARLSTTTCRHWFGRVWGSG